MATTPSVPQKHAVLFHGKSGEYFSVWLVNVILTIVTLGIYSAWATVRRRRYFYGNTEIDGDRFDYHARPLDILKGRIIVIVGLIAFFILSAVMPGISLVFVLAFLALIPWIIIRSWRYNALMSSYRGIRFNYHCRIGRAYWTMYLCPILLVVALYLVVTMVGLMAASTQSLASSLLFGGVAFVIFMVGLAVVQGIVAALNYSLYINNMAFGDLPFKAELSKRALVKMVLVSFLIILPFIIVAGLLIGSLFSSLFYAILFAGDPQMINALIVGNIASLIFTFIVLLLGGLVSTAWLSVAQRNYVYEKTRLGQNIQLKSKLRTRTFLSLILTNTLIVIFTLGLGVPVAEIRLARYLAQSTALEGDLALLNVHAHQDSARTAVAEEVAQAFDLNVGI
ncbi:YjgN family protein [Winslowiella iniecta]|uniref:Membrane protein n=1 Tax=Winslowiella iniecta TaxID=1560201 RepID=A0A0L7T7L1_9GAMM|nr:YjgN family protein [Winslowiella iniecta]KOC91353.1 membrane protein [Winslowiella iniecta]KOC94658.1 membrane protein [Winslowiella iniecta]